MRIIALDVATKTGWATPSESGVQDFTPGRGDSSGIRFLKFRRWLRGLLELVGPDVVVYEQAHYRGGAATEVCVGLVTRVQEECARVGIEYKGYHTATLKKHATGAGKASKGDMMAAAAAKWPNVALIDDNHADALWLLDLAQKDLDGTGAP